MKNKNVGIIRAEFISSAKALRRAEGRITTAREMLVAVVKKAIANNVTEKMMREWLVEAGYDEGHSANVVSSVMITIRGHKRTNTGPKAPKQALELLQYAVRKYGAKAQPYLLAAYRLSKKAAKK